MEREFMLIVLTLLTAEPGTDLYVYARKAAKKLIDKIEFNSIPIKDRGAK